MASVDPTTLSHAALMEYPGYRTEFELRLFQLFDTNRPVAPNYFLALLNIHHILQKEAIFKPTFHELVEHIQSFYNLDILKEYTEDGKMPAEVDFELPPTFRRLQTAWFAVQNGSMTLDDWKKLDESDDEDEEPAAGVNSTADIDAMIEPLDDAGKADEAENEDVMNEDAVEQGETDKTMPREAQVGAAEKMEVE